MNDDPFDLVRELAPDVDDQTALVARVRKDFMANINESNNPVVTNNPESRGAAPDGSGHPDIGDLGPNVTPISKNPRYGRIAAGVAAAAAAIVIGAVIVNMASSDETSDLASTPTSIVVPSVVTSVDPDASGTTPATVAPTTPATVAATVPPTAPPTVAATTPPTVAPTTTATIDTAFVERKLFLVRFFQAWEAADWTTMADMSGANSQQVVNEAQTYWGEGLYVSVMQQEQEYLLDECAMTSSCSVLTGDDSGGYGLIFSLTYASDGSGGLEVTSLLNGGDAG